MRIKKVRLKKIKRFDDLTIDLGEKPGKIVALIGPNGCGKSSVFDGMLGKISAYGATIGLQNRILESQYFSKYSEAGFSYYEHVDIVFDKGIFLQVIEDLRREGKLRTLFSFRSSYRYSKTLNIEQLARVDDIKENNIGATLTADLDDKITSNYQRLYIYINEFRKQNKLTDEQANEEVLGKLNQILIKCLNIQIVDVGDIIAGKGKLYFKTIDEENIFEYNVLSSGEKECVDILLDIFLKKDYYNNTIYLIDEPELHLNTSIQKKIIIEIEKLIPEDCQLWISTHSIGFIRAFQNELYDKTQILDFSEDNYAVGIKAIKPLVPSRNSWNRIFKTAIDDLTNLLAPKRIVYCEGKFSEKKSTEELGIDAKVFSRVFSNKYTDTLFVSSGGNTELDQRADIGLAVLNKVFTDIEIWILKDRDFDSGKYVDEEKRQEYLRLNTSRHRVLNRWELENYLFDKEILKKYCESKSVLFNEEKYGAVVSDIINDDVKGKFAIIKSCCSISYNISSEMFKELMADYITPDTQVYRELEGCIFYRK